MQIADINVNAITPPVKAEVCDGILSQTGLGVIRLPD